jgi:ubiquinone biosynthesis protein COQ4
MDRNAASLDAIPPFPRQPLAWRTALRKLKQLLADPDDTAKAVELFHALGRNQFERAFQRLRADPCGRRLLAARPELLAALGDRAALERLPEGSFGRAYLEYLDDNGFAPGALVALNRDVEARLDAEEGIPALDPARAWFRDRTILLHDLLHVLSGYGTDDVGEATLLAFSLAQQPGPAGALLALGAALEVGRELGLDWLRYDFRAWRRGRRARWLAALPYEELLPLPLGTVQGVAGIPAAADWHPGGILRGAVREGRRAPPRARAASARGR